MPTHAESCISIEPNLLVTWLLSLGEEYIRESAVRVQGMVSKIRDGCFLNPYRLLVILSVSTSLQPAPCTLPVLFFEAHILFAVTVYVNTRYNIFFRAVVSRNVSQTILSV